MLITAARNYIDKGINVIATDQNKRSIFTWKQYQSQTIKDDELFQQFMHSKAQGIAIICGAVSGNLEVIDVDCKYALEPGYFDKLASAMQAQNADLFARLHIVKTKSAGYHIYYRCPVIEGNQKLAMRLPTDAEHKANPQVRHLTMIETRGEAGYVIAPPTEAYVNVTQNEIPTITADERDILLSVCRSFNQVVEPHKVKTFTSAKEYGLSPYDDYNKRGDVIGLLQKHGWTIVYQTAEKVVFKRPGNTDSKTSGDYNFEKGWFSVFTTNSIFEPNKAYRPYAVYAMLECGGDFKAAARKLSEDGYGEKRQQFGSKLEREIFRRKQDGIDREAIVNYVMQAENKTAHEAAEVIDTLEKQWGESLLTFWDVNPKTAKIEINRNKLRNFLTCAGGFYIYLYDKSSTIFKLVRWKDGFIEETSTQQIKEFIKDYIDSLPDTFDGGATRDDLMEVILKGSGVYFTDPFFEFLDKANPDFLRSTKYTSYFPFNNGVVVIDKEKISLKSYGELGKTVWRSQVVPFDIQIDQEFAPELCEYFRFLECISGEEQERRNYAMSISGYLLHTYKDASKPYAIILAEETENDKDGGGTGKGIFVKGLSKLLRTVKLDGKNFKIDKTFALQRVSLDTQLISIEDCDKGLDFEKFNSQITEGSVVEKKNKDELFIDYADSPKFIFSTNYMLNLKGNHGKRRSRVFEFSPFFKPEYTPVDHFKHLLFDDWDEDEWNRFYNLMFFCVSLYLEHGLKPQVQTGKLRRKNIKVQFGEEFLDYYTDLTTDQWLNFSTEYNNFLRINEMDKKDFSAKRFRKALEESSGIMGYEFQRRRNRQNNNAHEFNICTQTT